MVVFVVLHVLFIVFVALYSLVVVEFLVLSTLVCVVGVWYDGYEGLIGNAFLHSFWEQIGLLE